MSYNLKNLILDTAKDMAVEFMDRRDDEDLSEEDLEKAIKDGVVTVEEIAETFKNGIRHDQEKKTHEFYEKLFDDNRIAMAQYENLRDNFQKMVEDVLGKDYYNMGMDVYECDRICCEDITRKAKMNFLERIFNL